MKKIIGVLVLAFMASIAFAAADSDINDQLNSMVSGVRMSDTTTVNTIETTAFGTDGSVQSRTGLLLGIEYAPFGDYKVHIGNGKNFQGERFSVMVCKLKNYIEDVPVEDDSLTALSTAFTIDGKLYNVIGYYSGTKTTPVDNYQIIIINGRGRTLWNSMVCKIY